MNSEAYNTSWGKINFLILPIRIIMQKCWLVKMYNSEENLTFFVQKVILSLKWYSDETLGRRNNHKKFTPG